MAWESQTPLLSFSAVLTKPAVECMDIKVRRDPAGCSNAKGSYSSQSTSASII